MRSRGFIGPSKRAAGIAGIALVILAFASLSARADTLAVIPVGQEMSAIYAEQVENSLKDRVALLDRELILAAFSSFKFEHPTNLRSSDAAAAGSAIGCDAFLIIEAGVNRRSSSARPVYFEAYAALFLVDSSSGRLLKWFGPRVEADTERESVARLLETAPSFAREILDLTAAAKSKKNSDAAAVAIETLPESPEKGLQPPIPYRRIKPKYTEEAERLGIAASVEILVDIGEDGSIKRIEIVRWAGYGLEGSVENAVRSMNWRPAYRGGRPIAMRVLLRYNFKRLAESRN